MNRYDRLLSNTAIFGIGNLLSKSIVFLLLPLQTYALSQAEYGIVDLVINFSFLLIPIFSVGITEAAIRFSLDGSEDKSEVLTIVLLVPTVGGVVLAIVSFLVGSFLPKQIYAQYFMLIYFTTIYKDILTNYCKGIDKNLTFSISGVVYTLFLLLFNYIFLIWFPWGIDGYFTAVILANSITLIFALVGGRLYRYFRFQPLNKILMKEMLAYSWPVLLNTLAWWITNISNRYIIALYLGMAASGIYAVSSKIPLIPITLIGIFQQAWQLSAIKEFQNKGRNEFFSTVYRCFLTGVFLITSAMFLLIKPLAEILFQKEFFEAWLYVPLLLVSAAASCVPGFWGSIYAATKKTKDAFYSTLFGAALNIILNFSLIPYWGIQGAAVSTIISYIGVAIYRIRDTKKYVEVDLQIGLTIISCLILLIQTTILLNDIPFSYMYLGMLLLLMGYAHRKNLNFIYIKMADRIKMK